MIPKIGSQGYNALQISGRTVELMKYYNLMRGVMVAKQGHPEISMRYIIGPSEKPATANLPIVI